MAMAFVAVVLSTADLFRMDLKKTLRLLCQMAMAKHIRALKSIVDDNDESYAVQKAFAQLTEEFFRENTLLLLLNACLLKLTLEVQRDATQVVANLRRQKVQLRLIASEYLQKNTDDLDLLVVGCGNIGMANHYGEMMTACLRHQSAARYVLDLTSTSEEVL
ncbi:hypothetical protein POTOM_061749 [Populus tomentosa]|uniref:Uncharacterized protein n=1 Tax=Populus tomentosa TaxID=118781 RepID=A0A8X7XNT3_POPTO|nr:hypothetical protein POTOM_061749 [Populus tomentosa]